MQYTPLIIPFLVTGAATLVLAAIGLRRRHLPGFRELTLFSAGGALWNIGFVCELASTDETVALYFSLLQYIGIAIVASMWVFFVLAFADRTWRLRGMLRVPLALGTAVLLLAAFTTPLHRLFYASWAMVEIEGRLALVYDQGPLYFVFVLGVYAALSLSVLVGIRGAIVSAGADRTGYLLIAGGTVLGALAGVSYVLRVSPIANVDTSPLVLTAIGCVVMSWTLRYHIFEVVPIGRDRVFDTTPDGVLVLDLNHRVLAVNPAATAILGVDGMSAAGLRLGELLPSLDAAGGFGVEGDRTGATLAIEAGGANRYYEGRCLPVRGRRDRPIGWLVILRDVHEARVAREALTRMNHHLRHLTSLTRHDIANRVTVLLARLEIARSDLSGPDLLCELDRIESDAQSIAALCRLVRDEAEDGNGTPIWHRIDRVVSAAAEQFREAGVRIECAPTAVEVHAAPLFFLVCANLVENAIRHGGPGLSTIRCSCTPEGPDMLVVFEDDGCGVPEAEKERIFLLGVGSNTGLGLYLSREILEMTGITIREVGAPGVGARFELRVPRGSHRSPLFDSARHPGGDGTPL